MDFRICLQEEIKNVLKKKPQKKTKGFSCGNMLESLASIKQYSAVWRCVDKQHVVMTTLLQKFQHSETVAQHINPQGMKDIIMQLLRDSHCLNPNVLPQQLRNGHLVLIQTCKTEEWTLVIANSAKEPTDHKILYCSYCQTQLIPCLIQEFKSSSNQ